MNLRKEEERDEYDVGQIEIEHEEDEEEVFINDVVTPLVGKDAVAKYKTPLQRLFFEAYA